MKQMFTLTQLAERLESDRKMMADYIAPSRALVMQPDAKLSIGDSGPVQPLRDSGHKQLATLLDIDARYYDRVRTSDPTLLAANVNHWLGKRDPKERRMVRTIGETVRALLSDSYRRIDNHEVAEVSLNMLAEIQGLRVTSSAVTDSRLYIKAVASSLEREVKGSRRVGDVVQAGVIISNSEIGDGSVSIKPFAEFLVCTNGMVRAKEGLRMAHIGRKADASLEGLLSDGTKRLEDQVVLRKVRDVIAHAFNPEAFDKFMASLTDATQQAIPGAAAADVVEALGPTSSGLGLNQAERKSVLGHLIEGGDLSRYGLVNAVTRTAQDAESYDRATELETAGFQLLELPSRDWQRLLAQPVKATA